MQRGVLFQVWGGRHDPVLDRALASLKAFHPELPVHVHRAESGGLLDKASMADLTPFDATLFLDADAVVMGDLSFGFDKAERHGLACCVCECPWARRYPSLRGDAVEYNTGVLFFTRESRPVFDRWREAARTIDSSILHHAPDGTLRRMECNDQAGFAKAVEDAGFNPYVLPLNWNLRPAWHRSIWGPVKVWHDYRDPPSSLVERNLQQSRPDAIIDYVEFR